MLEVNQKNNHLETAQEVIETNNSLSSLNVKTDDYCPISNELLFNSTNISYTILEGEDITDKIFFYCKDLNHNLNKKKYINDKYYQTCHFSGIITRIVLVDFPKNKTYFLSLNDQNVDSASFDFRNGNYFFDFAKENKSDMLKIYIETAKSGYEPYIENRNDYINFDRIDSIKINASNNTKFDKNYKILLFGYFMENGEWINNTREYQMYTTGVIKINCSYLTHNLIINAPLNIPNTQFMVMINDKYFGPFELNGTKYVNFENPTKTFFGKQNIHLNDIQNMKSINLAHTHINNLSIILLNNYEIIPKIQFIQNRYITRSKEFMLSMFNG